MIRRWSCINNYNLNTISLIKFEKKFNINQFSNLINFKKFFFKFSKFKRKSISRMKHRTTWLIYSNVISLWTKDFFFIKKYIKIQFFYNIFFYNIFFYNINFIKNKGNNKLINNFNFIYSFFNKKIYNYYNFNLKTFQNINLLYSYSRSSNLPSPSVIPLYYQYDNTFFPIQNPPLSSLFSNLFNTTLILNQIKELYKILIIINYYFINFKNF